MERLRNFLALHGFDTGQQVLVTDQFKRRVLQKGSYFAEEGYACSQLAFVETGLFQFYCNRNGDEITTYTAGPDDFLISLGSFLKQQLARESIRALTNSVIWSIDRLAFTQLRRELPLFEAFYVGMLEEQITCIEESRYNLLTLTAEQRYQKLLDEEPQLLQEVPLHYLASILGVTPRHLSRIRGQVR